MIIRNLTIKSFRNYYSENVVFNEKENIFVGDNAQGKTNLIEAVYYLLNAKSFKKISDLKLINFNDDSFEISGVVEKNDLFKKIKIRYDGDKKKIYVNDVPFERNYDLQSMFSVITFIPDDLKIIKETPGLRRDFIDEIVVSIDYSYKKINNEYNKILREKNKTFKLKDRMKEQMLDAYDKMLAKEGTKIVKRRRRVILLLNEILQDLSKKLEFETIQIDYKANVEEENPNSYLNVLKSYRESELKYGKSLAGVHRDEIDFLMKEKPMKYFASQGQNRSAILLTKIAQLKLIKKVTGDYPVILLDDVFSELDKKRAKFLTDEIKKVQSIITTTDFTNIEVLHTDNYRFISNGHINKKGHI